MMKLILLTMLSLSTYACFADDNSFRYTKELTQSLETDALSAAISGHTYEIEAKLCQRIKGPAGQALKAEYSAWLVRNDDYLKASGRALNELGNQFLPHGGEQAKQGYFQDALYAMVAEGRKRIANEMDGANLDNDLVPLEKTCNHFVEGFRVGYADFKNIPEETVALREYMKRTKPP